jgi:hypothetical protein
MSVCACGRITDDDLCDHCAALAVFGLARNATPAEIKDAHRTLTKVWHPDRFQTDERLRVQAEEKLKEINSAYQLLTAIPSGSTQTRKSAQVSQEEESQQARTSASAHVQYRHPSAKDDGPLRARQYGNRMRLAIAVAILVAGGTWFRLHYGHLVISELGSAVRQMATSVTTDSHTHTTGNSAVDATMQNSAKDQQTRAVSDSAGPAEKPETQPRSKGVSPGASVVVYPSDDPLVPYFTAGSTKDDVVRLQGSPERTVGNVFVYGRSEIYFRNGRVESWRSDPSSPLKARMPYE